MATFSYLLIKHNIWIFKNIRNYTRIWTTGISTNKSINGIDYYDRVINSGYWSEVHGFEGTLIYSNNTLVDGWSVAQIVLEHTNSLTSLVAVNPVYIFPYALAKRIASLSFMYNRRIDINWIAGGF